jgi:hypothetical protein
MASASVLRPPVFPAQGPEKSVYGVTQSPVEVPYKAPEFDPKKHMCYVPPEKTITLAELNLDPPSATSPIAITAPFPLLTEEGVRALRTDIFRREVVAKYGSLKYPGVYRIRGYGPDAPFTYALWRSELMRQTCSAAAGVELEIIFDYEIGQLNVQLDASVDINAPISEVLPPATPPREEDPTDETIEPGEDLKGLVSAWHIDSYPWVCVLMLSDPVGMKGGETALRTGDGSIVKWPMPGMGYAVMMQGGSINHAALRCLGKGERITFVTSFRPKDPVLRDTSSLRTVKPISNTDVLFRQWTIYRLDVLSQRAAVTKKELNIDGRSAEEIKNIFGAWAEEQIEYLRTTVEEML